MAFPQFEVLNPATEIDIARTISGTSAANGLELTVTDTSTISTGTNAGLTVSYTTSGTKTGGTVQGAGISVTTSAAIGAAGYLTGLDIYLADLGGANNYTVGVVRPLAIYVGDIGDNVDSFMAIDIGLNSSSACASRHCFIRCREHTAIVAGSAVMRLEGANSASYFLIFDNPAGTEDSAVILDSATCDQSADHRIRVYLEHTQTVRYIYLYPV